MQCVKSLVPLLSSQPETNHSLVFAPNKSEPSPSTRMHCNSFRILQSCHNVSPGFVCDSEGHHRFVAACGPKQDFGGPVISHTINTSNSGAWQNLLDWEWIKRINSDVLHLGFWKSNDCVMILSYGEQFNLQIQFAQHEHFSLTSGLSDWTHYGALQINITKIHQCHWGLTCREALWTCRCRKGLLRSRQTPQQSQRKTPPALRGAEWCPLEGRSWVGFPAPPERWPTTRSLSPLFEEWVALVTSWKRYCLNNFILNLCMFYFLLR